MTDNQILTPDEMAAWWNDGQTDTVTDMRVWKSHEALRAALEAAEQRAERAERAKQVFAAEAAALQDRAFAAEAQVAAHTEALHEAERLLDHFDRTSAIDNGIRRSLIARRREWRKRYAALAAADQTDDRWAPVKEAWANDPTHDSIYYAVERVMRADQTDEGDK